MSATNAPPIQPPANDPPIAEEGGQHSLAWQSHFQDVADRLNTAVAQIAQFGRGVTDGSDAPAGDVGELLSTSVGTGALTSATPVDRVTLTLPAGDWDVAGSAVITPNVANMTFAQAWLNTTANTPADPGRAGIQSGGAGTLGATNLVVGPVRFSSGGSITVHLGCQANFPGGTTVTASAFIRARRMR